MKRTDTVIVNKRWEEITSKIRMDMSDDSEFPFNFSGNNNYLMKRQRELNDLKPFVGSIKGNVIQIGGKGLKYWPKIKIVAEELEHGKTKLKITYGFFTLYLATYCMFFFGIFLSEMNNNKDILEIIKYYFPLIMVLIALPILARWMQMNTKKYLKNC